MSSETFDQLLDRAAALCGIDTGYWDIWGRHHPTTPEGKKALLRAMGIPSDSAESLETALAAWARRQWETLLPPAVVAGEDEIHEVPITVPAESLDERARIFIKRE